MKKTLIKNTDSYDNAAIRLAFDRRTVTAALAATAIAVGLGVIFGSIYLAIIAFVATFLLSVGRIEGMTIRQHISESRRQIRNKDYDHTEERLLLRKNNVKGK